MITFMCFILYTIHAPWWVYVLTVIGLLSEFDGSNRVTKKDLEEFGYKISKQLGAIDRRW